MMSISLAKAGWSVACTRAATRAVAEAPEASGNHQAGVLHLLPHRSAVFAIQRHVYHASAKLFGQLSLHLQALAHASFHTAVVIAHRQCLYTRLGAEQYFTGWSASIISYRAMCAMPRGRKIVWPLQIESKGHSMSLTALKLSC